MSFHQLHPAFERIVGSKPTILLSVENTTYPFAHEAGVFIPGKDQLFITSNRLRVGKDSQRVQISKISLRDDGTCSQEEIDPEIPMANGGINYNGGILFCSQGTYLQPSSLILMESEAPYRCETLLDSFNGRQFNSINDVAIHRDGSIWFTDPIYGYEQKFRPSPQLPAQVYRYDPVAKTIRAMADGFGRPNGIAFSPDENIVYITDTDCVHGDGNIDPSRASTIYAFDIRFYGGQPFLMNRRLFAFADCGVPDGIKCDIWGNVYSGCGDGIHVWSPGGVLLGKILIPGGVSNFCFGGPGELWALNETRLWKVSLDSSCRGSFLKL